MSILTKVARIDYLKRIKAGKIHFAFGAGSTAGGSTFLDSDYTPPSNGEVILGHQFIANLILTRGGVVMVEGSPEAPEDYFVDYQGGLIFITPSSINGDPWTLSYTYGIHAEDDNATELIDELFRKEVVVKEFLEEDEEGEIILDGVHYSMTETPTRHLLCEVWLEPGEATNSTPVYIRECGVFLDTVLETGAPTIVRPEHISDPGTLLLVQNYPTMHMSLVTRFRFRHAISLPMF